MGDDFFRTRMGHRFFESTMPKIADELERLNTNLEALLAELRKQREAPENVTDVSDAHAPARDSKYPHASPAVQHWVEREG